MVKALLGWARTIPNHLCCKGAVKSLELLLPTRINGGFLPRTALGEEDGSLSMAGG